MQFTSNSLYPCLLYNQGAGITKSFCGREFLIHIILLIIIICNVGFFGFFFCFFTSQSWSFCGRAESPCPVPCPDGYNSIFLQGWAAPGPAAWMLPSAITCIQTASKGMFLILHLQTMEQAVNLQYKSSGHGMKTLERSDVESSLKFTGFTTQSLWRVKFI